MEDLIIRALKAWISELRMEYLIQGHSKFAGHRFGFLVNFKATLMKHGIQKDDSLTPFFTVSLCPYS